MNDLSGLSTPVLDHFHRQALVCRKLGSRFTCRLLECIGDHLKARIANPDPLERNILDWPGDPAIDALALRLAGGFHALVLDGRTAPLTALDDEALAAAVDRIMVEESAWLADFIDHPPQTNEVARSGVLAPGFLAIDALTDGRPMRLLELGSSAGLNQLWPRFRYETADWFWGDDASPVMLRPAWEGSPPPLRMPDIRSIAGVDLRPIDVRDPAWRLRLRSYIWADQDERLQRLDAALALAMQSPPDIDAASADHWLESRLADAPSDVTNIVFHSIVWQYFPDEVRQRCEKAMTEAAAQGIPVAWLRMEGHPEGGHAVLELDLLEPGAAKRRRLHLADCHFHGAWVRWYGTERPISG
ncbi:MAG: DUF2332 family protein [Geminicoccaceae bacterium]